MRVLPCVLFIVLTEAEEFNRRRQGSRRGNVREELLPENEMRHFNSPQDRAGNLRKSDIGPNKKANPANAGFLVPDDIGDTNPIFDAPVPFGHIYKDGFADTLYGVKQPMNFLEYRMRLPKDIKEKLEYLEHGDPQNMQFFADPPGLQSEDTPRERYMREKRIRESKANLDDIKFYDLEELHERNLANPPVASKPERRVTAMPPPAPDDAFGNLKYVELFRPPQKINFTTCDELAAKSYFHPNDIVNLEWIPFYIWSTESVQTAVPHTFTFATKKFVNTYREIYKGFTHIDWERPKLLMKGKGEFLIISADKRGLFHALQVLNLPDNFLNLNATLPYAKIRIKTMDPYVILMYCDRDFAMAMAVLANIPPTDSEKIAEAESMDIRGPGVPVTMDKDAEVKARKNLEKDKKLDLEARRYMPRLPFMFPQPPNEDKPEEAAHGGMGTFE